MPNYHFNLSNGTDDPDRQGTELADDQTARTQAVIFAGECLRDNPELIRDGHRFGVRVTDDDGRGLIAITIETSETTAGAAPTPE